SAPGYVHQTPFCQATDAVMIRQAPLDSRRPCGKVPRVPALGRDRGSGPREGPPVRNISRLGRQREDIAMKSLIILAAALAAGVALSSGAIAQDKPKLAFVVNA